MKISLCRLLPLAALFTVPSISSAATTSVDSTTIVRFEQRDAAGARRDTAPITQFLGLDLDELTSGLSLHFYGWGRADLAEKSFNSDRWGGSLTYGYLQYRPGKANADVRVGRFFVYEGVVNEQVDGLSAHTDLPFGFGLSAFGGATVHTANLVGENTDGKGNSLFGGRLNYRYRGMLELGLSGVYESTAPTLSSHLGGNHRIVGGDVWLSPLSMVELAGHTSYNTETSQVAEHSYLLNVRPLQDLTLSGRYDEERDRSYFYAWTLFSGVALDPGAKSRSFGASVSYRLKKGELSADYRHYKRDRGNADRYGGDAKLTLLDNKVRTGVGYHYLRASDAFAISGTESASYHTVRGYVMGDTASYFGALDATAYIFSKKVFNEKSTWETTASAGWHITPALALSGDVSYGRNVEFTEEVRGVVRLTYNMTYSAKGGSK